MAAPSPGPSPSAGPRLDLRRSPVATLAVAALAPLLVALVMTTLGEHSQAVSALLMAAVVVVVASSGRRSATVVAVVSSTACFAFFLTVPYHSFAVNEVDDLVTLAALLFVGAVVVALRTKAERHRDDAEDGRNDIARLHAVAELVSEGCDPHHIVEVVRVELVDLLQLQHCSFDRQPATETGARMARTGLVQIGDLTWSTHHQGFPDRVVELPVTAVGVSVGRFVLSPTPLAKVPFDKCLLAVALADQVGAAFALSLA